MLRNDDLDRGRVRPEFVRAFFEDLTWLGLLWDEGPDVGGPFGPYDQSARLEHYREGFEQLRKIGAVYPCTCSRQEVLRALSAPHAGEEEPIYPGTCRDKKRGGVNSSTRVSWRFRVPRRRITFEDGAQGRNVHEAGKDFGDFVVWRPDDLPSYQLACVLDDEAMGITEVVRGADLLPSTARQLLLYEALGLTAPAFYHCPLVTDRAGVRLAKRHDSLSIRELRRQGKTPDEVLGKFSNPGSQSAL